MPRPGVAARKATALDHVSFETTCFGGENPTASSGDVAAKLRRVAELQRLVARATKRDAAGTLSPAQIGALLFQGARLVTASAGGELLAYGITGHTAEVPVRELLVSPRAARLPVGAAILELLTT